MFRSRGVYIVVIVAIWGLIVLIPYLSRFSRERDSVINLSEQLDASSDGKSSSTADESSSSNLKEAAAQHGSQSIVVADGKGSADPETSKKGGQGEVLEENLKEGDIRQGNSCLDNMERGEGGQAGTYQCHGEGGNQYWFFTRHHLLRNKDLCLEGPEGQGDGRVLLRKCHAERKEQKWEFEADMFIQSGSKQCLDSAGPDGVILRKCDVSSITQRWKF